MKFSRLVTLVAAVGAIAAASGPASFAAAPHRAAHHGAAHHAVKHHVTAHHSAANHSAMHHATMHHTAAGSGAGSETKVASSPMAYTCIHCGRPVKLASAAQLKGMCTVCGCHKTFAACQPKK
ncbi:MAG: hypothetical protein LC772_01565 [Chloroflexi bacterium]|nr:hypothetical protein [Chloroflexota bacterium]